MQKPDWAWRHLRAIKMKGEQRFMVKEFKAMSHCHGHACTIAFHTDMASYVAKVNYNTCMIYPRICFSSDLFIWF